MRAGCHDDATKTHRPCQPTSVCVDRGAVLAPKPPENSWFKGEKMSSHNSLTSMETQTNYRSSLRHIQGGRISRRTNHIGSLSLARLSLMYSNMDRVIASRGEIERQRQIGTHTHVPSLVQTSPKMCSLDGETEPVKPDWKRFSLFVTVTSEKLNLWPPKLFREVID